MGVLVVAILLLILLWVAMENNIMLCRTYDKLKKEHQEMERFLQEKLRMDGEYFDAYANMVEHRRQLPTQKAAQVKPYFRFLARFHWRVLLPE